MLEKTSAPHGAAAFARSTESKRGGSLAAIAENLRSASTSWEPHAEPYVHMYIYIYKVYIYVYISSIYIYILYVYTYT